MSLVAVASVMTVSAAYSAFQSHSALKSGTTINELALLGFVTLCVAAGLFLYLLVFSSMLGDSPGHFVNPGFASKGDRSILFLYAIGSGGLTALVASGLARIASPSKA